MTLKKFEFPPKDDQKLKNSSQKIVAQPTGPKEENKNPQLGPKTPAIKRKIITVDQSQVRPVPKHAINLFNNRISVNSMRAQGNEVFAEPSKKANSQVRMAL